MSLGWVMVDYAWVVHMFFLDKVGLLGAWDSVDGWLLGWCLVRRRFCE